MIYIERESVCVCVRVFIPSKLGDKTNFTLGNGFERIRAAEAAGDGTHASDKRTQAVNERRIPSMCSWVLCIVFDLLGISWLQVGRTRGLHVDQTTMALSVAQGLFAGGICRGIIDGSGHFGVRVDRGVITR